MKKYAKKRCVAFLLACIMMLGGVVSETIVEKDSITVYATDTNSEYVEQKVESTLNTTATRLVPTSESVQNGTNVTTTELLTDAKTTTEQITTTEQTTTEMSTHSNYKIASADAERKAVWFSFFDIDFKDKTKDGFTNNIKKAFDDVKKMGMNTVVCHVRPFSDAMYQSKYFPWSKVASSKQGRNPGYDPMAIMIEEAHKRGLRFEAWLNPYRVSSSSTSITKLASNNPARKWRKKSATKRNVLTYNGGLYYNPSKAAVRQLITNGVKEIVQNYNVDAIHFDDYFYPSFNRYNYKYAFDGKEYRAYVKNQKSEGNTPLSIQGYRKSQVNKLLRQVYSAIKKINPSCEFGISPAGNLDNLKNKYMYYTDVDKWVEEEGYVDYLCPQIYWGFKNGFASYDKVLARWLEQCEGSHVKLYVGLGMYRTTELYSAEFRNSKTVMKRQVAYSRKKSAVKGFYFFTYNSFTNKRSSKEKKNLVAELKKKK